MVSLSRWQRAQSYEQSYWRGVALRIASGAASQLDWYRWRAEQLAEKLRTAGLDALERASVIEVGSGPIGVVSFLSAAVRVAVDPLEPYYGRNEVLTKLRAAGVDYRAGVGERLPCESGRFDLAIIENCIDHVQDPSAVLAELGRALKPGGILYLTVNCRTRWGYLVHRVLSRLRLDPGHPYTFTPGRARAFLESAGFNIISYDVQPYAEARRTDLESAAASDRLKGFLGVSEFLYTVVGRRCT